MPIVIAENMKLVMLAVTFVEYFSVFCFSMRW